MLVRLFGSNFRSLKGEFELSMVAADLKRDEDSNRGVIEVQLAGSDEPLKLLRAAAIFGHNASGKSTVLLAARALNWLVSRSSELGGPGTKIAPYAPFVLDSATRDASVNLGCDVVHGDKLLRYEISYRAEAIERERLIVLGDTENVLIDRPPSGQVGGSLIACSEANQLYVKEMQPNVAVLSKLAQHGPAEGPDSVRPYYLSLANATKHEEYSRLAWLGGGRADRERFADDAEYREWVMQRLIVAADVGIQDVLTRRVDVLYTRLATEREDRNPPEKEVAVSFVHRGTEDRDLPFDRESAGTRKIFGIAGDWWMLAHETAALFADELGASLHPRLLDALIRAVNDAPNRVRSQLIFATHEVGLLEGQDGQPPALRRDQVYFTKKNHEGATELYSLAEFKDTARPVHNLRKRYLSGLYGAVPLVEKLSL